MDMACPVSTSSNANSCCESVVEKVFGTVPGVQHKDLVTYPRTEQASLYVMSLRMISQALCWMRMISQALCWMIKFYLHLIT